MSLGSQSRLAVLVHADVVGSTALVRKDEQLAHDRIQAIFRAFGDLVERYGGTVREIRGDALVAEFSRASDAVLAALAAQTHNARGNAALADEIAPELRVGIALGEVVVADSTVTGAGIVMAQRLEQLANPGGICISGAVREAVPDRLPIRYESLGDRDVKGFDEPVRAYSVSLAPGVETPAPASRDSARDDSASTRRRLLAGGLVGALIVAGGGLAWWEPWKTVPEPSSLEATGPSLSEKPSIAVLPFNNLSNDPDQEYFSDGLSDDLITDLSRISGLLVIARNSSFAYKGRSVNLQQVGRELGARYVLEGSVRRAGGQVRINAQLIDTRSGTHLWAERYDRDLTDVFALEDEVTRTIVGALSVSLTQQEKTQLETARKVDPETYDALLRGNERLNLYSPESLLEARALYQKAIELDPDYARAYANLTYTYSIYVLFGWSEDKVHDIEMGIAAAEKALALDDEIPQLYFSLGNLYVAQGRPEAAALAARRSVELDPNYADGFGSLSVALTFTGDHEEALAAINHGIRLNPRHSYMYLWVKGRSLFHLGHLKEAAEVLEDSVERNPSFDQSRLVLAATYGQMGQLDDADWQAQELLALRPGFSIAGERSKKYKRPEDLSRYIEGLRKAGLPE